MNEETLFEQALNTPEAERGALMDRECAGDAALRGRVETLLAAPVPDDEVAALSDALDRLAAIKPEHAKLVELRYFAGLTGDEAGAVLGVSPATADRMWRYARAWLQVEMGDGG